MNIGIFSNDVPHPVVGNSAAAVLSLTSSELVPCFCFLRLYILCGSAFVFKPFPVSPRHFSQNLSSEFFNSSGFRPSREAPEISFSVRGIAFESLELSDVLAIFSDCGRACVVNSKRRNAMLAFLASFHAARTRFRVESAIMKVVYTVIRMESALLALQQVMTLATERRLDCASVLQEIFNNLRILFLELTRKRETQRGSPCSNLAIYSLEMPNVERSGRPGRPRFEISEDVLLELRSYGVRSTQPKFQPVRSGKVVHLKRWTRFFQTFPVGPNRSIECWTEISGHFG